VAGSYKKIFWGIIFATFHINIGTITILPVFIGWIIVAIGISELDKSLPEACFTMADVTAVVLVAVSFVEGLISFFSGGHTESSLLLLFFPFIALALELEVFHKTLEASARYFLANGREESARNYTGKDRTYLILMGITIVLFAIARITNSGTIVFAGAALAIITRIYLLTVIYSLSNENFVQELQ